MNERTIVFIIIGLVVLVLAILADWGREVNGNKDLFITSASVVVILSWLIFEKPLKWLKKESQR